MITNKIKLLNDLPDGFYLPVFSMGILGLVFGVPGLFMSPHALALLLLAPLIAAVLAFFVFTSAYERLSGPHRRLFENYFDNVPEQVRKDFGTLTLSEISEMTEAEARQVNDALEGLWSAYNRHRTIVPNAKITVLLDNAETATKTYKELV